MPGNPLLRALLKSIGLLEKQHLASRSSRPRHLRRYRSPCRDRDRQTSDSRHGRLHKERYKREPSPRGPSRARQEGRPTKKAKQNKHCRKKEYKRGEDEDLMERFSQQMLDYAMNRYLGLGMNKDKDKDGETVEEREEVNGIDVGKLKELAEQVIRSTRTQDDESTEADSYKRPIERGYYRHGRSRNEEEKIHQRDSPEMQGTSLPVSSHRRHPPSHTSSRNLKGQEGHDTKSVNKHGLRFGIGLEKELEDMKGLLTGLSLQSLSHDQPDREFCCRFIAQSDQLLFSMGRIVGRIREINGNTSIV